MRGPIRLAPPQGPLVPCCETHRPAWPPAWDVGRVVDHRGPWGDGRRKRFALTDALTHDTLEAALADAQEQACHPGGFFSTVLVVDRAGRVVGRYSGTTLPTPEEKAKDRDRITGAKPTVRCWVPPAGQIIGNWQGADPFGPNGDEP